MKTIYLSLFCLMGAYVYSQAHGFKKREVQRLERLGIVVANYDLADSEVAADFKAILKLERKRKTAKAVGIASVTVAGIIVIASAVMLTEGLSKDDQGSSTAGAIFAPVGGIVGLSSILPFKQARDLKAERDKLVSKYLSHF